MSTETPYAHGPAPHPGSGPDHPATPWATPTPPKRRYTAWRTGLAAVAVTLLAATATACNGDDNGDGGASGGSSASGSSGSGSDSGGSGSGGSDSSPGAPADSGSGSGNGGASPQSQASDRCTSEDLAMKLGRADAGAGNLHYDLSFTNKGSRACTLSGYPGVSLIQRDGGRIGKPATHEGRTKGAVRLAPGSSAHATLHTLNKGIKDGGCWKQPDLVKAYPPGSRSAMTLRSSSPTVCGDAFSVTALQGAAE